MRRLKKPMGKGQSGIFWELELTGKNGKFVRQSMRRQNVLMTIYLIFFTVIIEVAVFCWSFSYFQFGPANDGHTILYSNQIAYLLLIAVCLVCGYFLRKYRDIVEANRGKALFFIILYCLSLLMFGLWISGKDISAGLTPVTFITTTIWIFDVLLMKPLVQVAGSAATFVALAIVDHLYGRLLLEDLVNYIILLVFINLIGFIHYSVTRHRYIAEEELAEANKILQHMSFYDGLTGLKNRVAWTRDVEDYHGSGICVLICDIDDFKAVNDTFGHAAGDEVLKAVSKLLSSVFGASRCYRFGGDEFVIVPEHGCRNCERDSKELKKRLSDVRIAKVTTHPTISIGAAVGDCGSVEDIETLMRRADIALYDAKNTGKNRFIMKS